MLFDIHTHISQFNNDELEPMRQRWNSNNVGFVLSAGTNVNDSYESIKLAKKYSDIYAGIGLHPTEINENHEKQLNDLFNLINDQVITISEIGLDYLPDSPDRDIQKYCFLSQIEFSFQHKLPIIFHMRESNEDTIKLLGKNNDKIIGGASHYFQGTLKDAQRIIDLGMYVSFAKPLLRDENLQKIAECISIENIVLETDSYPQYFKKNRERWTEPKDVLLVAKKLANLKNIPIEEIIDQTTKYSIKLFKLSR